MLDLHERRLDVDARPGPLQAATTTRSDGEDFETDAHCSIERDDLHARSPRRPCRSRPGRTDTSDPRQRDAGATSAVRCVQENPKPHKHAGEQAFVLVLETARMRMCRSAG